MVIPDLQLKKGILVFQSGMDLDGQLGTAFETASRHAKLTIVVLEPLAWFCEGRTSAREEGLREAKFAYCGYTRIDRSRESL